MESRLFPTRLQRASNANAARFCRGSNADQARLQRKSNADPAPQARARAYAAAKAAQRGGKPFRAAVETGAGRSRAAPRRKGTGGRGGTPRRRREPSPAFRRGKGKECPVRENPASPSRALLAALSVAGCDLRPKRRAISAKPTLARTRRRRLGEGPSASWSQTAGAAGLCQRCLVKRPRGRTALGPKRSIRLRRPRKPLRAHDANALSALTRRPRARANPSTPKAPVCSGSSFMAEWKAVERRISRSVGAAGAQVPYKHKVTGSNPSPTTTNACGPPGAAPGGPLFRPTPPTPWPRPTPPAHAPARLRRLGRDPAPSGTPRSAPGAPETGITPKDRRSPRSPTPWRPPAQPGSPT